MSGVSALVAGASAAMGRYSSVQTFSDQSGRSNAMRSVPYAQVAFAAPPQQPTRGGGGGGGGSAATDVSAVVSSSAASAALSGLGPVLLTVLATANLGSSSSSSSSRNSLVSSSSSSSSVPSSSSSRVITEKVLNPYGSTAGAGSGEFHTYRHGRTRELSRLSAMDDADNHDREVVDWVTRSAETRSKESKLKDKRKRKSNGVRN